ncbi:hypothetical protein TWF281_008114 [Arthrobotrys megalospora]
MDPNSLNVIVPSEPLRWWAFSKIANWRRFVGVAGIKDTDPRELSIFDWKIIFEIALRSSTWRLCPSMAFTDSCEVPILGIIQEVDFVTGKALFRLHPQTIVPLLKQHAKYISSRQKNLPPQQALQVLQAFERRIDVLQIRLHARVLDATDGTPGADFPKYAADPSARKSVLNMLGIVLRETGLRKTILDAFVEIKPSVPSFVFSPGRSLSGDATGSVPLSQSTQEQQPPPPQFPLGELHTLISKPQPLQQRGWFDPNIPPSASSTLKRKQTSSSNPTPSPEHSKRTCTPLTRAKLIKPPSRPTTATSSPLTTEIKWSDPLSPQSVPRELPDLQRSRKSPSACPSLDSGIDTNTPAPEVKQPTITIIPDERSPAFSMSRPSNTTTIKVRRASLNNDELTIYNMDSSFAPITRQQAARELKKTPKTPNASVGVGSVRTLRSSTSQRSPSMRGSPPQKPNEPDANKKEDADKEEEDTDEEADDDDWYDTHEEMELDTPQNQEPENEEVEEVTQEESYHTARSPKAQVNPTYKVNRFGITLRKPGSIQAKRKKRKKKKKTTNSNIPDENEDYTDWEDLILDSDTPTLELLCDSENSDDHRDRKHRRRERKKLKKEKRKNTTKPERVDLEIAALEAELERRKALEMQKGPEKEIIVID